MQLQIQYAPKVLSGVRQSHNCIVPGCHSTLQFFCQLCMSIRTLHKKFHGLWAKIVNLRANTRDRIQIQKQLYANKSSYFGDWIRSTIFGLKLTVFDLGQRNLVGSIPRNTPTQRKKLQGAVILRDDAIMTCRPDRTFGAYCISIAVKRRKFKRDDKMKNK